MDNQTKKQEEELSEEEKIDQGFTQMETLYKSRCVQAPAGNNVTVTEIENKE